MHPADDISHGLGMPMLRVLSATASDSALSNTKPRRDDRQEQRKPLASGGKKSANQLCTISLRDFRGGVKWTERVAAR
jgi:hypothetical protein